MIRRILTVLALVAALPAPLSSATIWEKDGHEIAFNGYLRAGYGWSKDWVPQICFWAPGASAKYRLGNECDMYSSVGGHAVVALGDNPVAGYVKIESRIPMTRYYGGDEEIDFDEPIMNYVELGNLAGTSAKFWIGRRESFLEDVHITDYNYMNLKGDGLGVYDIPAGPVTLAVSYNITRLLDTETHGKVHQHNYDFGVRGVPLNPGGSLDFDMRLSRIDDDESGTTGVHAADGWAFAMRYFQDDVAGGQNTLVVQYGTGSARAAFAWPAEADWVANNLLWWDQARYLEDARTLRVLDTLLYEGSRWSVMTLGVFERRHSSDFDSVDQIWVSAGARASWYFGEHWRVTGEYGLDYVRDLNNDTAGTLGKKTLALEWAPDRSFYARPAFRIYATRADWSSDFKGRVGWPVYSDGLSGWSTGFQVEYWW